MKWRTYTVFDVSAFILKNISSHIPPSSFSYFHDVLGPGYSWQRRPGLRCFSRCSFWWRRDIIIWALASFSPTVFNPPFSLYCSSQDPICYRRLHHPSHLAVMFCTPVGSVSRERLCLRCTRVGMPWGCVCFRVQVAVYLHASSYKEYLRCLPLSFCCVVYWASSDWQVV